MMVEEIKSYVNRFNELYKKCNDLTRSVARQLNISECALWILSSLAVTDTPLTQSNLGQQLSQPRQTIHSAIKTLESKEIIQLVSLEGNQKEKQVVLTNLGEQYVQSNIMPVLEAERAIFARMGKKESEELIRLMQKYVEVYDKQIDQLLVMKYT